MSDHAIQNAKGWLKTITAAIDCLSILEESYDCADFEGEEIADADDMRERLDQMPLSVQVRTGWFAPGNKEAAEPEEFEILLSTGGPALRVYGDIGGTPVLQWQDWGTPWTTYHDTTEEEDAALQAFVAHFWLGE